MAISFCFVNETKCSLALLFQFVGGHVLKQMKALLCFVQKHFETWTICFLQASLGQEQLSSTKVLTLPVGHLPEVKVKFVGHGGLPEGTTSACQSLCLSRAESLPEAQFQMADDCLAAAAQSESSLGPANDLSYSYAPPLLPTVV